MKRIRASFGVVAVLSGMLLLAGCNDSDSGTAAPASSSAAATDGAAAGQAQQSPPPSLPGATKMNPTGGYWPATVQLGHNDKLGDVVVDGEGFTLYRFDKDTAHPSKSNCVDATCVGTWPPVLANDKIVFRGLDRDKITTVQRPDGTQQVCIGGWPAYRFAKDQAPGETNGQGVKGTWFALAPDGSKAGVSGGPGASAPGGSDASTSGGSSGY